MEKFQKRVSVLNKNKIWTHHVVTEEKFDSVDAQMEAREALEEIWLCWNLNPFISWLFVSQNNFSYKMFLPFFF
jgi:hypothetical protein